MKIGILTFHCAHNYGAVLQCYALQEYLKGLGHDVKIINYRPKYLLDPYKIVDKSGFKCFNPLRIAKSIIREILLIPIRYVRHYNFSKFIKSKLKLTSAVKKDEIPSSFDIYIVGSDQVWNPRITRGFDNAYFCNFPFPKADRLYLSYAASMEANRMDDENSAFCQKALLNFDSISVREKELKDLLQPLTDKTIYQVLDPTLLLSRKNWEKITPRSCNKEKYVLTYQVRERKETEAIAQYIADQLGATVINLVAWVRLRKNLGYQTVSPENFIGMIKNAECVVTTSFHGTAFSIIYNKPFYAIRLNDGNDSRVASLLTSLNLENRFINLDSLPEFSTIDYNKPNHYLECLRQDSENYIYNAINKLG